MIAAQGGDPHFVLPVSREQHIVTATTDGVVSRLDALAVGVASRRLGAGRDRKEDSVQAGAGIRCLAKRGDTVVTGQPIFELRTDTAERLPEALADLDGAIDIDVAATPVIAPPLVIDILRR
jgi:thymidine phosphorylase